MPLQPHLPSQRHGFALGLGISALLHAALVLPWLVGRGMAPPTPRQHQQLMVEVLGMVGNHQVEAQQLARKAPEAAPAPAASPAPARRNAPAPAPVLAPTPRTEAPTAAATPPASMNAAPPAANEAQESRVAQTVQPREADPTALRRYLAALRRAVQGRLIYPQEARELGWVGTPTIGFTITDSGEILPGSLALHTSSGHAVLDDNALRAATASGPFERPPRQMAVVIAVSFAQDR